MTTTAESGPSPRVDVTAHPNVPMPIGTNNAFNVAATCTCGMDRFYFDTEPGNNPDVTVWRAQDARSCTVTSTKSGTYTVRANDAHGHSGEVQVEFFGPVRA